MRVFLSFWYKPNQHISPSLHNFAVMIYTKYFSGFTKQNGQPNLSPDQFKRMMNIIFVEGILQGINQIKTKEKQAFRFDILLFNQDTVLTDLTGNLSPKELVREMFMLSGE